MSQVTGGPRRSRDGEMGVHGFQALWAQLGTLSLLSVLVAASFNFLSRFKLRFTRYAGGC